MPSAVPAVTRNLRDGIIRVMDGTGTPKTLKIKISEGDFSFKVNTPNFIVMNRGVIDSRKKGDETPSDISFTVKFEQWSFDNADAGISIYDALKGVGGANDWVSTDGCGPFAVDIMFELINPCDTTKSEKLTFLKFSADSVDFKEGNETNTLTVSGKALVGEPNRSYGDVFVDA